MIELIIKGFIVISYLITLSIGLLGLYFCIEKTVYVKESIRDGILYIKDPDGD